MREIEEKRQDEEIEEHEGEPTIIATFFHREMEDVDDLGVISTVCPKWSQLMKKRKNVWKKLGGWCP